MGQGCGRVTPWQVIDRRYGVEIVHEFDNEVQAINYIDGAGEGYGMGKQGDEHDPMGALDAAGRRQRARFEARSASPVQLYAVGAAAVYELSLTGEGGASITMRGTKNELAAKVAEMAKAVEALP